MSQLLLDPATPNENNATSGNAPALQRKRGVIQTPDMPVHCSTVDTSPRASPSVAVPFSTPASAATVTTTTAPPVSASLPEGSRDVTTPVVSADAEETEAEAPKAEEDVKEEETAEARMAREAQESEDLARMLMAEEAEASFALQYEMLQSASSEMSDTDLVAVQALLRADEEMQRATQRQHEGGEGASDEEGGEEDEEETEETVDNGGNYDELIALGRAIGDVKAERWAFRSVSPHSSYTPLCLSNFTSFFASIPTLKLLPFGSLRAQRVIDALPVCVHSESAPSAYDSMCIFCQDEYAAQDEVRVLPCKHGFHKPCVDEWLLANNSCPLCKVAVAPDEEEVEVKAPAPGLFN